MGSGMSVDAKAATNVANNSTVSQTDLKNSTQIITNISVSTLSLVTILGFVFFIFLIVIYAYMKFSHSIHHERISNLARLTGFGSQDLSERPNSRQRTTVSEL